VSQGELTLSRTKLVGLFIGIDLALFLSALDQTILNTAVPKMAAELGDFDLGPWIITSYLLMCTIVTPFAGKLADTVGTKRALAWATGLFVIASLLCGLAPSFAFLIAARGFQGVGGGAMISLCFISIGEIFSARERGKYQGILAAAFIVAAIIGPALGGWLADHKLWRWVFYINVPLGFIASICLMVFFPHVERIAKEKTAKLFPAELFKSRLINICLVTVFVTGIGLFSGSLVLALLLQETYHTNAAQSGYALTPLMLLVALASILGGLSISRTGRYKIICIAGLILMSVGVIQLAMIDAKSPLYAVFVGAGVSGLGLGLLLPVHAIVVQNSVDKSVLGVATSMTQLFRSLGGTIGTALLSGFLALLLKTHSMQMSLTTVLMIYAVTLCGTTLLNFFMPEVELKTKQTRSP
jgi:MFS family permease